MGSCLSDHTGSCDIRDLTENKGKTHILQKKTLIFKVEGSLERLHTL